MTLPRRAILWATPAAVVVTAAPALAVSQEPALTGLMRVTYAPSWSASVLTMTTQGSDLGLRVEDSTVRPDSATLTVYYSASIVPASTTWSGTGGGWARPTYARTEGSFTVWELRYTGAWTQTGPDTWAAGAFTWRANVGYSSELRSRAIRTAVIAGQSYTTDSGVVTIGTTTRAARSVVPASDGGGEPATHSKTI
ncbi:hypothetical protein [Brachybacterium nesterenkovii]|uniref:hypothetical protein n=1 Tax=Brachybacterium nesterenkovii TaxID=47847 RepID=UPI00321C067C